jgi:predicted P-loop ATPase
MHKPNDTDWRHQLQRQKNGTLQSNLFNAHCALDGCFGHAFYFDEMNGEIIVRIALWAGPRMIGRGDGGADERPLSEEDVTALQCWLQSEDMVQMGRDSVFRAIERIARANGRHPLREWLYRLEWDGQPRLKTWLADYLGCNQTPYSETVGEMFLVSMVARVFKPGAKVDHMLVLEGEQGTLKSSACEALAGHSYFSDSLPDIATGGKDLSQHLRGKWLLEIPELSAMSRAENSLLKSFISRREERYRPPYGRVEVHEKRQCVFVGTTNSDSYLRDETGARRYWPVKCGIINLAALKQDRDQLFAEAVSLYQSGAKWWPDRDFAREHIQPEQEKRFEPDPWEEQIEEYLGVALAETGETRVRVSIGDIAKHLGISSPAFNKNGRRRIADSLHALGWRRREKKQKGKWVWERPV